MRRISKIIVIVILFLSFSGCATIRSIVGPRLYDKDKVEIEPPQKEFREGEILTYRVKWLGIPVGEITLSVDKPTEINGHEVYHIVSKARSNRFLSPIYKIKDRAETFIDKEEFFTWRFEKHLREGGYRCNEIMEYDQINHQVLYRSLKNNQVKEMSIPPGVQDSLSSLYYFRLQPVEVGESVFLDVNADEKNWKVDLKVKAKGKLNLSGMGTWKVFRVEPSAKFRRSFFQKGRAWFWFSADSRRIPVFVSAKAKIFGTITASLKSIE